MTRHSPEIRTRVLMVMGTRPEAIKMAPVVKALAAEEAITGHVCVTAQHREMLDQVARALCHPPGLRSGPHAARSGPHRPYRRLLGEVDNIHLIAPLDYLPFVALMDRAYLLITDSGGIQEEAPALGKPVLIMRDTTERPEAVAAGTARLVGTHVATIVAAATKLLDDERTYRAMSGAHNPYGDGRAAARITATLRARYG